MCLFLLSGTAHTQSTELFISEYVEGTSNNKAIEIFNPGSTAVNLATAGYNIQMFFNGNPVSTLTINLTGTVAPGDVYVLAHGSADPLILALADQTNSAGWFNGDDAIVLRKGATVIDSIGQVGFDPGTEWGTGTASTADNTLRRKFTVTAGDVITSDAFVPSVEWDGFATNSFDNLGVFAPPPPPTVLEIFEIQGNGNASPYGGQRVETLDNIVTGITTNGFFMQMPDGRADASDETSNGIFVFTGSAPGVQVGDQVDVIATVAEFFEATELTGPEVAVESHGHDLPAAMMLGPSLPSPVPPINLERLEGMRVRAENALVASATDQFGDIAVVLAASRPFREPGIAYPGVAGYPTTWDGNPEIFEINPDGAGQPNASFVAGATIDVAEGPLQYSFGDYQIWPTTLSYGPQPQILRPVRARAAGEFSVGSQNLLRFFDNIRDNGPDDGAANAAMYPSKLVKASLHIRTVLGAPDVLVIEEVENLGVAQALATQIAADDPSVAYTAYLLEGHDIGGIDTGVLVRDTVAVSSVTQLGYESLFSGDTPPSFLHDRPPLVVRGTYTANGAPFEFTVVGVHNRSLSDIETSTRVRQKRLEQALEIANYVQSIQQAEPARRVVVIGDFNAFQFSDGYVDAIGLITGNLDPNGAIHPGHIDVVDPNLVDQVSTLPEPERYSFVFDGSAQVLDHTLTTANLSPFIRGLQFARGNADAPATAQADPTTPLRLSDHDGEVLFVMTDRDADGLADDADACPASVTGPVTVGACTTSVPDQILSNGCSITDTLANFAAASPNHGGFVSEATQWLTALRQSGAIDNKQRGEIVSCAARSK